MGGKHRENHHVRREPGGPRFSPGHHPAETCRGCPPSGKPPAEPLGSITRHDILNKISIILGYLALSKKKCRDPEIASYLEKLETATQAIKSQIDFTRVYQDLGSHEPQWQNVETIIRSLQIPSRIRLEETGPCAEVYADPMFRKVFENFLDNTIRHGKNATCIRVLAQETPEGLVLTWENNGAGIPSAEKEQIFARGYGSNTGLGLFLVREILTITGITIRETGDPKTGVRFEILVPKGGYRPSEQSG
jgi:signal transduction histidine kinase